MDNATIGVVVDYLEDAFWSLDKALSQCDDKDKDYKFLKAGIDQLKKAHDNLYSRIKEG